MDNSILRENIPELTRRRLILLIVFGGPPLVWAIVRVINSWMYGYGTYGRGEYGL